MTAAPVLPTSKATYFCYPCHDSGVDPDRCWYVLQCPSHGRASLVANAQPIEVPNVRVERWVNGDARPEQPPRPQGQVTQFRDGYLVDQQAQYVDPETRMLVNAPQPTRALPPRTIPLRPTTAAQQQSALEGAESIVRRACAETGPVASMLLEALVHLQQHAPGWSDLLEWLTQGRVQDSHSFPSPPAPPVATVLPPVAMGVDFTNGPNEGDDNRPLPTMQYSPVSVAGGTLTQTESPEDAAAAIDAALAEARAARAQAAMPSVEPVAATPAPVQTAAPVKPRAQRGGRKRRAA